MRDGKPSGTVLVACETGKDLAVGTALAILCWCFDESGAFRVPDESTTFTKNGIKVRLGAIMAAFPEANPSRTTLQSVNRFLMEREP
jgi:tRNA A64-2'-O-ribosylphosphate transferase